MRIDTPNIWVTPAQEGAYEISVDSPVKSQVVAEAGSVAVFAAQGHEWVDAGQKMLIRGDPSNPQFKLTSALTVWKRLSIALSTLHVGGGGGGVSVGSDDPAPAESAEGRHSTQPGQPAAKSVSEAARHEPPVSPPASKVDQPGPRGKE